uniref:Mitochondrial splicing suppressor 51-like C-terminal domain-containing protein n=1 Tax=Chromera velia CCMP2878 TaxID=1169474 RepID=A0A0G4IB93_9ALVE|eukprot:Cvel_2167.t1-p1 / transcript=Cvel_2167.t1 / gene=Cvel_2167 / organism=Chromera_velia_CCMP2878 / gene_product=hypothetical protein / transcript_product=hypothetical protein / location=Cvel_scaffold84:24867-26675(+) / protein_length=442 / sequence_SO=supercontig / SO=protein_coding / is_pseudo=false
MSWESLKKEATSLFKQSKFSQAAEVYRKVLDCPDLPANEAAKIHTNLALIAVKLGKKGEVRAHAERAIEKDNAWWKGYTFRAWGLLMGGSLKKAGEALIGGVVACRGLPEVDASLLSQLASSQDMGSNIALHFPFTVLIAMVLAALPTKDSPGSATECAKVEVHVVGCREDKEGSGNWEVVGEALQSVPGLSELFSSVDLVFVPSLKEDERRMRNPPRVRRDRSLRLSTRMVDKPYEVALQDGTLSLVPGKTIVIFPGAGLDDHWPTWVANGLVDLVLDSGCPLVVTGYCRGDFEGYDSRAAPFILSELLGARCVHPPVRNPFRYSNESAQDMWTNGFFYVVKGRKDGSGGGVTQRTKEEYLRLKRRMHAHHMGGEVVLYRLEGNGPMVSLCEQMKRRLEDGSEPVGEREINMDIIGRNQEAEMEQFQSFEAMLQKFGGLGL